MDTTDNRGYLLPTSEGTKISLNLFHTIISQDLIDIDRDIASCINRLETNAIFATGITSGKVVYRDTDNSYKLAIADNSGKDTQLGISDISNNYVFSSGIITISQSFSIGDALFLSDLIAGNLTTDNTGVFIGFYQGSNKILMYPKIEIKNPILFGSAGLLSFSPNSTLPIINYTNKNLSYLDNTNGIIEAKSAGSYKIDCFISLETNNITSFEYDLLLSVTGLSDTVIYSNKFDKSTANFNISSSVVRNLLKGNNVSLKLMLYNFVGIIQLTTNDIVFKMEKI